jgi:hypothetical protein
LKVKLDQLVEPFDKKNTDNWTSGLKRKDRVSYWKHWALCRQSPLYKTGDERWCRVVPRGPQQTHLENETGQVQQRCLRRRHGYPGETREALKRSVH